MNILHKDDHEQEGGALDGAAAILSSLCLVHCLLLPLALALLPMLAAGVADELVHGPMWVHWLLIGLAAPVSIHALRRGSQAHHRHSPWLLAFLGFALMAAGALAHGLGPIEPALTVSGGLVVAFAHWRNWKARKASPAACRRDACQHPTAGQHPTTGQHVTGRQAA